MRLAKKFLWACGFFLPLLFISAGNAFGIVLDDYTPEVTARVVRISFIRGDVQIRRADENGEKQEWERAALNLPIVEGDEIATGQNTVVEIQLDSYNHIRLWENAYLKFTTLRDEGIAVSLPQGTMSLRARVFDKNKSYFEVDAPGTTLSIERTGMYRVEAGNTRNTEIRVSATEEGEAKIYTQTSGFTLRSGRTARIIIEGNYAGDYDTSDVASVTDEFDEWVLQRDAVIAKRLNEAYYDKYYDRDQFGAEDLNDYGEWIYTRDYGYVWKPYANTVSSYYNWSPYRYGHWRWVPFYGWTWVNDESWGWATYHHGRWVWHNNFWVWSPYGYYRWRRSWWQPAMVTIVTWNGSTICWYPTGWNDNYYDFNRGYRSRNRRNNNGSYSNNNPTPNPTNPTSPNPTPTTPVLTPAQINEMRRTNAKTPTLMRIPPSAVVAVGAEEFGKRTRGYQTAPLETAKKVLSQTPSGEQQNPPILPDYKEIKGKIGKDILIENPRVDDQKEVLIKTGASTRVSGKSLDQKLQNERIFGNRQPTIIQDVKPDALETKTDTNEPRKTGVVNRRAPVKQDDSNTETQQPTTWNPQPNFPTRTKSDDNEQPQPKNEEKPVRRQRDENQNPPIYQPQPQPQPREEERRRPQPTFPQQRQEERKQEEPRPQPQPKPEPKREEPRPQPQPKPEPKQEEKPVKPNIVERKTDKDSRK